MAGAQFIWTLLVGLLAATGVALFFSSPLSASYWGSTYSPGEFWEMFLCALMLGVPVKAVSAILQARYLRRVLKRSRPPADLPSRLGFSFGFYFVDLIASAVLVLLTSPLLVLVFFTLVGVPVCFCFVPFHWLVGWLLWPSLERSSASAELVAETYR